jgi:hypothetical protein
MKYSDRVPELGPSIAVAGGGRGRRGSRRGRCPDACIAARETDTAAARAAADTTVAAADSGPSSAIAADDGPVLAHPRSRVKSAGSETPGRVRSTFPGSNWRKNLSPPPSKPSSILSGHHVLSSRMLCSPTPTPHGQKQGGGGGAGLMCIYVNLHTDPGQTNGRRNGAGKKYD